MNNKKLFKGALVLFASILMAVSCSNNPANPENQDKNDNTTAKTFSDITFAPVGSATAPATIEYSKTGATGADDAKGALTITFKTVDDKTGVTYNVKTLTRLTSGTVGGKNLASSQASGLTKDNLTYDGAHIKIKQGVTLSGWAANGKYDGFQVVIEISKEGYTTVEKTLHLLVKSAD